MSGCLLCRELNEEGISTDSGQWHELNIKNVIEKHLWPLSSFESASWVCNTCWQKLYDFHQYYEHIEKVHKSTVLITNITQGEKCSGTLSVNEVIEEKEINIPEGVTQFDENPILPLDMSIEEPELFIKTEIADDDIPLLERYKQEKCHKRTSDPLNNSVNNTNGEAEDLNLTISCTQSYYTPKTNPHQHDKFITQHFKITCILCHIHMETFQSLCKHFEIEHKQLGYVVCCKKKFYRRSILVDHINRHLDPNYFKCELCGKALSDRRCLELHRRRHLEKPEKAHCCDTCGKGFSTNSVLNKHKLIHLPEEEKHFSCSECGKNFGSKHLMTHHYRAVHLNKYVKICDICGKSLRNKDDFERHMLEHEGKPVALHSCDICGLLLNGKRGLKRHKEMIHPIGGQRKHTCTICGKISPNSKALKRHIQYKHEMGYDYKCTICNKAFKRAQILKEHMASHTGSVLYRCPWCPKTFNSSANLHSHRKKGHPIEWEELKRKNILEICHQIIWQLQSKILSIIQHVLTFKTNDIDFSMKLSKD
ncbi:hypothetical protein DOY81_010948 [Sarcophaga bullata]|nr:hypothetical protein DOY81_010948 [Sarcophaga bullata]